MKIKLLVVDDEVQIRAGIEKGIRWKDLGISDVVSAPNGVEALEIIKKENIDILITDVRMPGMDGLELAEKAKDVKETIHIIILSGFSEFEYAKKAINIGVKDYLLKPIKVKELTQNVAGIVKQIQEEEHEKNLQDFQQMKNKIAQYILMKDTDKNDFLHTMELLTGLPKDEKVICVLMEPDTRDIRRDKEGRERIQQRLGAEVKAGRHDFCICLPKQILYVYHMDLSRSRADMLHRIKKIVEELNAASNKGELPTISASVSGNCPLSQMADAVEACMLLLNNRLYLGTGMLITPEHCAAGGNISFYIDNEEQLRQYIIGFQYEAAQKYIARHFLKMKELKISSYDLVKGVCLTLKQLLFKYIRETGLDVEKVLEKNKNFMLEVPDLFTMEEYENWLCNLYYLVLKGVSEHTERNVSNTVMTAVAYISTHYQEELTVDDISAYVNKSKNYFSYLFKKEMKISFTGYLNKYRIEQACILLETTLDLAGEIGQRAGFKDEKYFSAVFKKIMGCPPSQYRKNRGLEEKDK